MASGGRVEGGSRHRARAASVVVPLPRRVSGGRLDLARLVPSGRSLALAAAIVLGAIAVWACARETGVFGVRTIEVQGAPPTVAAQVRHVLAGTSGTSLLKIDLGSIALEVEALPTVAQVSFDRAFPHTLRVRVVPERPVAVVRQGAEAYLVSDRGRVIGTVERRTRPALARIWVDRSAGLAIGATVAGDLMTAVDAVAPLVGSRFPGRVSSVTTTSDELTLTLRSGLEVRLGDAQEVPLKLGVAARVIPLLDATTGYLDVSVPERPVSGTLNSQVEGQASTWTGP